MSPADDDADVELREIRVLLEANVVANDVAAGNREIADQVFASKLASAIVLNAVAWQCRRSLQQMPPEDLLPVLYESWRAPDWRWAPYRHESNDHLRGFIWRVAQRTAASALRSLHSKDSSVETTWNIRSIEEPFVDELDLLMDLSNHILRTQVDPRVRIALLIQIETRSIDETAKRLQISTQTVERYLRAGMASLSKWLES